MLLSWEFASFQVRSKLMQLIRENNLLDDVYYFATQLILFVQLEQTTNNTSYKRVAKKHLLLLEKKS